MNVEKIINAVLQESFEIAASDEVINMPRKVQVTFTNGQWKLIEKLRGTIGETNSEIVRNIVISYLSEKSYIKDETYNKERGRPAMRNKNKNKASLVRKVRK